VPDDFTLSNQNMAEVQDKMPNRNGMTTAHAMWPGKELGGAAKPDVSGQRLHEQLRPRAQDHLAPARARAQQPWQPA
jgi:hypothetical protein